MLDHRERRDALRSDDPAVCLGLSGFNDQEAHLETSEQFRVYGPGADRAHDVEPEYLAVAIDSSKAWVTLQENNGLAQISLGATPSIAWVKGLGLQDFGKGENAADVKDDGVDYLLTDNEGDLREYPGFNEEGIVENTGHARNVTLSPTVFSTEQKSHLSDMSITRNPFSSTPQKADLTTVYTMGGRSFTIRKASTGEIVWDSGNYEEERSDEKSSEPESITLGTIGSSRLAFVGLEKASSIAIYNISAPKTPVFRQWLNRSGDVAPEGLLFVPAKDSPSGNPLLITSNEKSGTVSVWKADAVGSFSWASTIDLGSVGDAEIMALAADLTISKVTTIPIKPFGFGVNSVAVHHGSPSRHGDFQPRWQTHSDS